MDAASGVLTLLRTSCVAHGLTLDVGVGACPVLSV